MSCNKDHHFSEVAFFALFADIQQIQTALLWFIDFIRAVVHSAIYITKPSNRTYIGTYISGDV